ncbi:methyltransferase [Colwellia sp. M166]|uniref:methyltransferase n=1 Tax=Colwellia sp. M166 TaxID=2583805 RepID=UPI00211DF22E|nr:methyltransferase [Colwellia sp. M166]UUO24024.1 methyltransferase [Colwellia sp. M166]|tara:strand:+ start:65096 stop:66157 length:1062 start_codon:yes stop_codon:yes gene_type:complete
MAISNINQLLIRNLEAFAATRPLLVNIADDGFIAQYLVQHNVTQLDSYHSNYAEYQAAKRIVNPRIKSHFCVEYQAKNQHDMAIIHFPKSKAEFSFTLAMLAQSMAKDATIIIVGENKGGIKSAEKLSSEYLEFCHKVDSARHCLMYVGKFKASLPHFDLQQFYKYYSIKVQEKQLKIAALPGVFSQNALDTGTEVLLAHLPKNMSGKVLDFGCGAGVISAYIATVYPETKLSLVDVSALALHSAQTTLTLNQLTGEYIASDSLSNVQERYNFVISNPPFHQGVKTHYAATEHFLAQIKQNLHKNSCVTIVANSFLKYAPIMEQAIGKTQTLAIEKGFAIYQCELNNKIEKNN